MARRGFTLIEMLIALVIASFGIAAATAVARWAYLEGGRGKQAIELQSRMKIIGRQISADIEQAGIGSTGAVGLSSPVDTNFATGAPYVINVGGAKNAIAVARSANNITGPAGAFNVLPDTDALQVVVPDPTTIVRSTVDMVNGGATLGPFVDLNGNPTAVGPGNGSCAPSGLIYISDHSAPNGSGKTAVMCQGASSAVLANGLPFYAVEGADVMCARVSTYWVDAQNNLHRTDMRCGVAPLPVGTGSELRSTPPVVGDILTPGVIDFQVAFAVSPAYSGGAAAAGSRWFNVPSGLTAPSGADVDWFEVRQVRFVLIMRSLRVVSEQGKIMTNEFVLDATTPKTYNARYSKYSIDSIVSLVNPRAFDRFTTVGVSPSPY